jgi:hypothetical protein
MAGPTRGPSVVRAVIGCVRREEGGPSARSLPSRDAPLQVEVAALRRGRGGECRGLVVERDFRSASEDLVYGAGELLGGVEPLDRDVHLRDGAVDVELEPFAEVFVVDQFVVEPLDLAECVGIAALGSIFQSKIESTLTPLVAGTPAASHVHELSRAVASGGTGRALQAVPPADRDKVVDAAHHAFVTGFNTIALVSVAVAAVGSVAGYALVRSRDFVAAGGPAAAPEPAQV